MHKLPFETLNISDLELQALEDIYAALTAKLNVTVPDDVELSIGDFDLFNYHPDKTIGGILQLNHPANPCYLVFIKVHTIYYTRDGHADDYYNYRIYGCIKSKKDFGRILIRRENFSDRKSASYIILNSILRMINHLIVSFMFVPMTNKRRCWR